MWVTLVPDIQSIRVTINCGYVSVEPQYTIVDNSLSNMTAGR